MKTAMQNKTTLFCETPCRFTRLLITAALACLLLPALPFTASPPKPATVVPSTFLREYDPITVIFPAAVGAKKDTPEDHPDKYVKMVPPQPGAYTWLNPTTLFFRPAVPWPPLTTVKLTIGGRRYTLNSLMVPPVSTVPKSGAAGLDSLDQVVLTFKDPVSVKDLKKMVRFEIRTLPGVGSGKTLWLSTEDVAIKAIERNSLSDPCSYVFRFRNSIGEGKEIIVHLKLSLKDRSDQSMVTYHFSTKEPFRLMAAGCLSGRSYSSGTGSGYYSSSQLPGMLPLTLSGTEYSKEQAVNGGSGAPRLALLFSSKPGALSLSRIKALVHFSPSIPDMTFQQHGRYVYISGNIRRKTLYEAIINPVPLKDSTGRLLKMEKASRFYFYFPAKSPYLRWKRSHGILELHGPKVFPIEGRGDERVDLRVYKIDPFDRNFWPFPSKGVVVDESARPPGPGEQPENANMKGGNPDAGLIAQHIETLGSPGYSAIVSLPPGLASTGASFGLPLAKALKKAAGGNEPGTYLVGIRRLSGGSLRRYVRVQVTNLCLTVVEDKPDMAFLVTSLDSAHPVPGAKVVLLGSHYDQKTHSFNTLREGTTGSDGIFKLGNVHDWKESPSAVVVTKGRDHLILSTGEIPERFSSGSWHEAQTWSSWLDWVTSSLPSNPEKVTPLFHLLSDRPVYKTTDTVHIKGFVRLRVNGVLKASTERTFTVVVSGPGEKTWRHEVTLNRFGNFSWDFKEDNLPTGKYTCNLLNKNRDTGGEKLTWKMEAYKLPRFEVRLHCDDKVPMDRPFTVSLTASYYAGGMVSGRPVDWRVTQFPYAYVPQERKGYFFSSDQLYSRSTRFKAPNAIQKKDVTDASGASSITVNPALELEAKARRYVFEATVTGSDQQTVTAQRQVIALPPFVLGLKVERFLKNTTSIRPSIIALDQNNKLLAGKDVEVRLLSRRWHSHLAETDFSDAKARYVTDVVDKEVYKTHVKTGNAPVSVSLPAPAAGVYVVEISARDRLGRMQIVSVDLYVAGRGALSWKKPSQKVFETSLDKTSYVQGDTAKILLKSPFQSARVLAVVETPTGNEYKGFNLTGGKAVFELPIKNEYNPRIPVHFILMRGRLNLPKGSAFENGLDLGRPQTVAATTWVPVKAAENRLHLKLDMPQKALPGETITAKIHLTDNHGKPLPGEVTLWLVDRAVLALGREKRLDPLPAFIKDVESRTFITDTRNRTIGDLPFVENQGGGGEAAEKSILGHVTVRKVFKVVPYYNPSIVVGPNGTANVKIKLSDDLTVFMVRAVASSGATRFGFAKSSLAVRLPVIVQPALPRFARVGDTFEAGGIGRIVEGGGGAGRAEIKIEGAKLSSAPTRSLAWKKGTPEKLFFPMTVLPPAPGASAGGKQPSLEVTMAVRRDSDGAKDAFKTSIPVLPDRTPVTVETFSDLDPGKSLPLPEPKEAPRAGSLKRSALVTDRKGLLKMASGLDYLFHYTQLCTEQRVSMAFPIVELKPITDAEGLVLDKGRAHDIVQQTFDYLSSTLGSDGLYSFWPGGTGRVSLTAYVVEFLTAAKRAGYNFDARLYNRPIAALKQALRSDYSHFVTGYAFMERCDALQALSDAGYFDVSYGSELADKVQNLDLYSEAQVLSAYNKGQKGGGRTADKLRADLWKQPVFELRNGKEVYGGLQYRRRNWNGLVLTSEIKTQASIIQALYPHDAGKPKMEMMVNDLISTGTKDGWGDTNSTSYALRALVEVLKTPKPVKAPQTVTFTCGASQKTQTLDAKHPALNFVSGETGPGALHLAGKSGESPLFARLTLSYLPKAPGSQAPSDSSGFVVRREIRLVPKDKIVPMTKTWLDVPGKTLTFKQGDIIEVHAQVVNPETRHYVAVVVPFAAGFEPMNPNLATASPDAAPSQPLTLEPSYSMYTDSEVRFYYETLPKGTYDFYFRVRAMTAGKFVSPGAKAQMMYHPSVEGSSPGAEMVIQQAGEARPPAKK
jgi:alpha-2-macroglobulin